MGFIASWAAMPQNYEAIDFCNCLYQIAVLPWACVPPQFRMVPLGKGCLYISVHKGSFPASAPKEMIVPAVPVSLWVPAKTVLRELLTVLVAGSGSVPGPSSKCYRLHLVERRKTFQNSVFSRFWQPFPGPFVCNLHLVCRGERQTGPLTRTYLIS